MHVEKSECYALVVQLSLSVVRGVLICCMQLYVQSGGDFVFQLMKLDTYM